MPIAQATAASAVRGDDGGDRRKGYVRSKTKYGPRPGSRTTRRTSPRRPGTRGRGPVGVVLHHREERRGPSHTARNSHPCVPPLMERHDEPTIRWRRTPGASRRSAHSRGRARRAGHGRPTNATTPTIQIAHASRLSRSFGHGASSDGDRAGHGRARPGVDRHAQRPSAARRFAIPAAGYRSRSAGSSLHRRRPARSRDARWSDQIGSLPPTCRELRDVVQCSGAEEDGRLDVLVEPRSALGLHRDGERGLPNRGFERGGQPRSASSGWSFAHARSRRITPAPGGPPWRSAAIAVHLRLRSIDPCEQPARTSSRRVCQRRGPVPLDLRRPSSWALIQPSPRRAVSRSIARRGAQPACEARSWMSCSRAGSSGSSRHDHGERAEEPILSGPQSRRPGAAADSYP